MRFSEEFFKKLKEAGIEIGEPIKFKEDPIISRAVRLFILRVNKASIDAGKSGIKF